MQTPVAIIGGSGLYDLDGFEIEEILSSETPYGQTSAVIQSGRWYGCDIVFFPRHGKQHKIPPHRINYRANLWALRQAGISRAIAVNAVGGINLEMGSQSIVIPDQIIDYSWGREHTYSDGDGGSVQHVDFTFPFSPAIRELIIGAASVNGFSIFPQAVYGCTNGPRLETAAEIKRMAADGCDLVGMTAMPEAVLARELDIDYAAIAVVVNPAAGLTGGGLISMDEIERNLEAGLEKVLLLLAETVRLMNQ